jgi:hypothetical protein
MLLHLPEFYQPLLLNHWLLDVDWVFDWDFVGDINPHWHLDYLLFLDWGDIHWPVDVHWLLNDGRHLHCHRLHHLPWHFLYHLHRHFLLHLDILGNLDYFLNNPLGPLDDLGHLNDNLDRLFDDDFLDDFLGCSQVQSLYLILTLFDQPLE